MSQTPPSPGERLKQEVSKYLHLDDPWVVDIALATVVANTLEGDPLWLLLVNPSSTGKTEFVQMFDQVEFCNWIGEITENTFLSGLKSDDRGRAKANSRSNSLLFRLTDPAFRNGKPPVRVVLIQDLTGMITTKRDRRDAVFGQLRQIFDGRLVKDTGMGDGLIWEGYLGLLGAVTQVYDEVAELHSILGQRFVLYRPKREDITEEGRRAIKRQPDQQWRKTLASLTVTCVRESMEQCSKVCISSEAEERLNTLAQFTATGRTAVPREGYRKILKHHPEPEGPARLIQQFKKLLIGLCAVRSRDTPTEEELSMIAKIARDTIPKIRLTVIEALYFSGGTIKDLEQITKLPQATLSYLLIDLQVLGVVRSEEKLWRLTPKFQKLCIDARIFNPVPTPSQPARSFVIPYGIQDPPSRNVR